MEETRKLIVMPYVSNGRHSGYKKLRESCQKFHIPVEPVGIRNNHSKTNVFRWDQKIRDSCHRLQRMKGNDLVMLCDGYDVRILAPASEIVAGYQALVPGEEKILVCGERIYEHHNKRVSAEVWRRGASACGGDYCFPSTCCLMAPRKVLQSVLEQLIGHADEGLRQTLLDKDHCKCGAVRPYRSCDQSIFTKWLATHPAAAVIDTTAAVLWSTRGEHRHFMENYAQAVTVGGLRRLKNLKTNTLPCVLHVPVPKYQRQQSHNRSRNQTRNRRRM